jgi:hypothetical protein
MLYTDRPLRWASWFGWRAGASGPTSAASSPTRGYTPLDGSLLWSASLLFGWGYHEGAYTAAARSPATAGPA